MPQTANDDLLLPQRPRLVLRLGFAGRRDLGDQAALDRALDRVFASIGQCLAGLAPAASPTVHPRPKIADFYDQQLPPLLRLITGLSEGADTAAALALERMPALSGTTAADIDSARPASKTALETELAAVLPFDVASYRASRYGWFQAEFDRQAALCRYIVELDGIHARPEPDTDLARARRNKGYRAQSAVLLRQADLLVAAADPRQPGKAGGTLETVRAALSFGLPVIFIDTSDAAIRVVHPEDDLASVLSMPPPTDAQLDQRIDALVMQLVADPDLDANSDDATRLALLHEFFDSDTIPPAVRAMRATDRWRLRGWDYLKSRLESWPQTRRQGNDDRPPAPAPESSSPAEPQELDHRMDDRFAPTASPYHPWRDRAGRLNHHYGGLYRGAFVLGYGLALMAVLLASLSLVLLGMLQSDSAQSPERTVSERAQALASAPADPASLATPTSEPASHESTPLLPAWLVPSLVLLGLGKLGIVWFLARNTQRANDEQWSDLAVNYRYLAERLRAMYYLPLAASFQPPAAVSSQYASRVASQSAVDWLFNAIARSVSPAHFAHPAHLPSWDSNGTLELRLVRPRPSSALQLVRKHWVQDQVAYHLKNARLMRRLDRFTAHMARRLSSAVVAIVMLDLLLILWKLVGTLPESIAQPALLAAPWLMFLAALLPAAVTSLNGLRFQSECQRLAERSLHLRRLLGGSPGDQDSTSSPFTGGRWLQISDLLVRIDSCTAQPATDIGAWCMDALFATERVAGDCVQEVAEWSVLYAKELPEI